MAAWLDGDDIETWLSVIPGRDMRGEQRERLDAVRRRGYSIGLLNDAQREFASALDRLARDPRAVSTDRLTHLATRLCYDPPELTDRTRQDVRVIAAPVFDATGRVALAFTVSGFARPDGRGGIDAYIARAVEASQRATELLGGRRPTSAFA